MPETVHLSSRSYRNYSKTAGASNWSTAIDPRHSAMPWPLLKTQCGRLKLDPMELTPADVRTLAPLLARSVTRFASPEKGELLELHLNRLVRRMQ